MSTQTDEIRVAIENAKVDSRLQHAFARVRARTPEIEIPEIPLSFTTRLSSSDSPLLDGELGRISNIAAVSTTYRRVPGIVSREDVLYLEQ